MPANLLSQHKFGNELFDGELVGLLISRVYVENIGKAATLAFLLLILIQ